MIPMLSSDKNAKKNKNLSLLVQGYKTDFATFVFESEQFTDLLMELSADFIDENIPVLDDEEYKLEAAMLLMESIKLGNF